ncbi:short-chain dehydrogenase/reductase SDR [Gonapodya prolifera JEL478]|uniref:Short-chain dehydrogenase/reductase SDR n=1 Tax=Gonapodya prolifera (strain JEL478) TaxID=1344416 RepID=A0A139AGT2_GONPJ|nr:short-chain dehydrogenase/reductase SDR [Gonapodya prolifera JEL478]|eukprot:KXS16021.1 short-chain dehydrogenase/reductase SDR [Gonapodya prolifera JEL478]
MSGLASELKIEGKRGIVTGGSKGIGRAAAELLVKDGASVAICGRNQADLDGAVKDLQGLAKKGAKVTGAVLDVSDGAALKQWIDSVATEFGGLDFVVANVSALEAGQTIDAWKKAFEVDMLHTVSCCDTALPYLSKSSGASVVSVSSVSGREVDFMAGGPYGPMKAALIHYMSSMAFKHAKSGLNGTPVRFNTVSPGNTYFEGGVWQNIERGNPELFKTALGLNPTGRMATAKEVGNAIAFLVSDAASFISGTNIVVDGALTRGVQF